MDPFFSKTILEYCSPVWSDLVFSGADVKCSSSLNWLELTIDSGLIWKEHIHGIAAVASRKLGFLFGVRSYFSFTQLLALYKSHLEYCPHIWACAGECYLELLNKIQRRATRLVGDGNLTSQLALLNARRMLSGVLFSVLQIISWSLC